MKKLFLALTLLFALSFSTTSYSQMTTGEDSPPEEEVDDDGVECEWTVVWFGYIPIVVCV